MFNKTKRILALLLAVVLVFSLVGCSKKTEDGSSVIYQTEYEYEYVEGEGGSGSGSSGSGSGTSGSGSGTSGSGTHAPSTSNKDAGANVVTATGVNPADYKGVTIQWATTTDPKDDGSDYVFKNFEKEYGINVEVVNMTSDDYANGLSGLIAAGTAPTVGRSNGDFPACLGYFQSLDAAKLDYTDSIWNQTTFKLSTYNGSTYMCDTVGSYWAERDIVVYSKSMLKAANCPTPKELDEAGQWNFDTYLEIGKKTKGVNNTCKGVSGHLYEALFHMTGATIFNLDSSNHLTNGINNESTVAVKKIATAINDGYLYIGPADAGTDGLINGLVSMTTAHIWSLRTDGDLAKHPNRSDLGFYYLPNHDDGSKAFTGMLRGYGIIKGCNQNPKTGSKAAVAGGLFLREYLDISNYNLDNAFLSQEAQDFFFDVTSQDLEGVKYNPYLTYCDYNSGITGIQYSQEYYSKFLNLPPEQVDSQMAALKSKVENGAQKLNKFIDQQIAAK